MKILLSLCIFSLAAMAQDVVFRGTPTVRVFATPENDSREKLDSDTAYENECVIVQRGKKYFWASRGNAELTRIDAPQFTYFIHTKDMGYVKVLTGSRKETKAPVDYIESHNRGFEVITYWGNVASREATASR